MLHATTFKTLVKNFSRRKIPKRIAQRFILDAAALDKVALSLKQHYFSHAYAEERQCSSSDVYLSSPAGRKDWIDHLYGRLGAFRETVVPWLNSAKSLSGATILEIGCGTGSSTVALAEQGAKVVAVDINQESLVVAEDRCNAYSLNVDFFNVNATEVHSLFSGRHFDFIIFFAALEHMTHDERIIAMKKHGTCFQQVVYGAL